MSPFIFKLFSSCGYGIMNFDHFRLNFGTQSKTALLDIIGS